MTRRLQGVALVSIGALLPLVAAPGVTAGTSATNRPPHVGEEVCIIAEVPGGEGTVCAHRVRFGLTWDLSVADTADDGRGVTASIALDVADARDPVASLDNDLGAGTVADAVGSFRPRSGSAIGDLDLAVCVDIRLFPDRCQTSSAVVPQLDSQATPEQAARLEELAFEVPLADFVAIRASGERTGVDADFDWVSDGCSAGPVAPAFQGFLDDACLRHDFGYRNYGQLFLGPTDPIRKRVDEQLAADAAALGRGDLSDGLTWALQRFAAPVFFGDGLADVWGVPDFLVSWLRTPPIDEPADDGG